MTSKADRMNIDQIRRDALTLYYVRQTCETCDGGNWGNRYDGTPCPDCEGVGHTWQPIQSEWHCKLSDPRERCLGPTRGAIVLSPGIEIDA